MRKKIKPGRRYFIINIDEPYAEEIYEVLKRGQMAKDKWPEGDISFREWIEQTFEELDAKESEGRKALISAREQLSLLEKQFDRAATLNDTDEAKRIYAEINKIIESLSGKSEVCRK